MPLASGLQVLSRQECLDLLDTAQIGRIVFTDRALPAVQPVNFCLYGEHIMIRTSVGSKLAAATQRTVVAFEADDFDPDSRTGRSVTMVGHARALCREARSRLPELACLMLTSYADDDALFEAVMAGAAGYVLKQIHGSDLVGAVRTVASGQSLLDPQTTAAMLQRLREQAAKRDPLAALSDQERNILDLIGEGLTNRQIGERMFLAEQAGQELRVQPAVQTRHATPYPGGGAVGTIADGSARLTAESAALTGSRPNVDRFAGRRLIPRRADRGRAP